MYSGMSCHAVWFIGTNVLEEHTYLTT